MKEKLSEELLAVYDQFKNALIRCDREKLDEMISDDYRGISIYGQWEDKNQILEVYGDGKVSLEMYDASEVRTYIAPETGIITGRGYIRGRFENYTFEHQLRFTDIYVLRDSRWQLYISQATEIK